VCVAAVRNFLSSLTNSKKRKPIHVIILNSINTIKKAISV
jgi:hypothetical protein